MDFDSRLGYPRRACHKSITEVTIPGTKLTQRYRCKSRRRHWTHKEYSLHNFPLSFQCRIPLPHGFEYGGCIPTTFRYLPPIQMERGNPVDVFLLPPFLSFVLYVDHFKVELILLVHQQLVCDF